jgi:hypothetical protein
MNSGNSVTIGRDAHGNVIATGDRNRINAKIHAAPASEAPRPSDAIDIIEELQQIRIVLQRIGGEHTQKIGRAFEDATEEAQKAEPDKDEIGAALNRALNYARKSNAFAHEAGNLTQHLANTVAWLGSNWHQLLSIVGVAP